MKPEKIIFPLIAVVAIVVFVIFTWGGDECKKCTDPLYLSANPEFCRNCGIVIDDGVKTVFIKEIEDDIKALKTLPANTSHNSFISVKRTYDDILFRVNEYRKNDYFNDNQHSIFSTDLWGAYSDKFIEQSYRVLRDTTWHIEVLNFIGAEAMDLRNTGSKNRYLESNSNKDNSFTLIQNNLNMYNGIAGFITDSRNFRFANYDLSVDFPQEHVETIIAKLAPHLNNLNKDFLKNCRHLHRELANLPVFLYNSHINYLNEMIRRTHAVSDTLARFGTQPQYMSNYYNPLMRKIDALNHNVYKMERAKVDNKKDELRARLNSESNRVTGFFRRHRENQQRRIIDTW